MRILGKQEHKNDGYGTDNVIIMTKETKLFILLSIK